MEAMDPSKRDCFCNSFRAAENDITKGLSTSQSTTSDGHWTNWAEFC